MDGIFSSLKALGSHAELLQHMKDEWSPAATFLITALDVNQEKTLGKVL